MTQSGSQRPTRQVLWSGGWDSSYRVMELVLVLGYDVQPHYILDDVRDSLLFELRAMNELRREINRRSTTGAQLLPTSYTGRYEIAADAEISGSIRDLQRVSHISGQYDYLARYAKQLGTHELEMGLVDGTMGEWDIRPLIVERREDDDVWYEFDPARMDHELAVFAWFRYPIIRHHKRSLLDRARTFGFADLLAGSSWTCHRPTRRGQACGRCIPCRFLRECGLGRQMPWTSRLVGLARDLAAAALPTRPVHRRLH